LAGEGKHPPTQKRGYRLRQTLFATRAHQSAGDSLPDAKSSPLPHIEFMIAFDYTAPSEIFASKGKGASRRPMSYHRFSTAAEAIRFAIELLPPEQLFGTTLETNEQRFDAEGIRSLYARQDFPLTRSKPQ
jgi:hypothetical protein